MFATATKFIRRFRKDETGTMTMEFVLLFPLVMFGFVIFMAVAFGMMRWAMILDHSQQTARAYAQGFFPTEASAKAHLEQYTWNLAAAKEVSTTDLAAPQATVQDAYGHVTITVDIPILRLVSIVGYGFLFESWKDNVTKIQVRAPIEGRP